MALYERSENMTAACFGDILIVYRLWKDYVWFRHFFVCSFTIRFVVDKTNRSISTILKKTVKNPQGVEKCVTRLRKSRLDKCPEKGFMGNADVFLHPSDSPLRSPWKISSLYPASVSFRESSIYLILSMPNYETDAFVSLILFFIHLSRCF